MRSALGALALLSVIGCARSSHEALPAPDREAVAAPAASRQTDAFSIFELDAEWRDQYAQPVKLEQVAGKTSVVAMVYTSCTHTCPLIIASLKRIEAAVKADSGDVRFLLVSIDPDRDTPDKLASWAKATRLDENRWKLLVGTDAAIRELAVTLDVRYQKQSDGEIAHTNGFTIIDAEGKVVHNQTGYSDVEQAIATVRAQLRAAEPR